MLGRWLSMPERHSFISSIFYSLLALSSFSSVAAQGTSASYYVHSLPGAPEGPLLRMHAGHVEVSPETHGSLFFWLFHNRHIGVKQRTVIWLNGGPGCSSMDGALMEIGPYRVREGGKLEYSEGSWDKYANLLFVDNPVGTGFSFVDSNSYLHELTEMADHFIIFLEKWFALFPEYAQDDLYIAGESYAGQHIPYVADAILDRNARSPPDQQWNLSGLLIGNGWISGEHQPVSDLPFLYDKGLITPHSHVADVVEAQNAKCIQRLKEGESSHVDTYECEEILQIILRETRDSNAPAGEQCINMYDVKLRDNFPSCGMNWPPDLTDVTPYLRRDDVLRALNIDSSKKATGWSECSGQVSSSFSARNSVPSYQFLPRLLEKMRVTLFSGADDLICNHYGTEALIKDMSWNGVTGFPASSPTLDWTFDGVPAGTWRSYGNLSYVLFYNSSHMVPFDYPKRSRDMFDRFIGVPQKDRYLGSLLTGEKPITDVPTNGQPGSGSKPPMIPVPISDDEEAELDEEEIARLQKARWDAYYRSGYVALVVVIIAAGAWGRWVWKDRRRRAGYRGVDSDGDGDGVMGGVRDVASGVVRMEAFRQKSVDLDVERGVNGHANGHGVRTRLNDAEQYSLGSASDEESDDEEGEMPVKKQ